MVGSVLDFTFHQTIFQILFIHTNPFSPAQIPIRYPLKQGKLFHFFLAYAVFPCYNKDTGVACVFIGESPGKICLSGAFLLNIRALMDVQHLPRRHDIAF